MTGASGSIEHKEYDQLFKLVIFGHEMVGKSALFSRFLRGKFINQYAVTIGVDYDAKIVDSLQRKIQLRVWDTAGQDRFRPIITAYYRGADAGILCVNLSDNGFTVESHLQKWVTEFRAQNPKAPIIIAITKIDLKNDNASVYEANLRALNTFATANGITNIVPCSAKDGTGVDEVFEASIRPCQIQAAILVPDNILPYLKSIENLIQRLTKETETHNFVNFLLCGHKTGNRQIKQSNIALLKAVNTFLNSQEYRNKTIVVGQRPKTVNEAHKTSFEQEIKKFLGDRQYQLAGTGLHSGTGFIGSRTMKLLAELMKEHGMSSSDIDTLVNHRNEALAISRTS